MLGRLYECQLPLERQALAAAAELAAVEPGERLLDVATGTGGLPRELAARGARPREAVGLDRSASMLAVAAARLPPGWSLGGHVVTVTTASRRAVTRTLLERLPRWSGLRALDPAREFGAAGLRPLRARFVPSGWPSLCVLGERPSSA
jgi:SAM-dependent methyltransferase